jgi:hypothetical protein
VRTFNVIRFVAVGFEVGVDVGAAVGVDDVGILLGSPVGRLDGCAEEIAVGAQDGSTVGCTLAFSLGITVGAQDGCTVGGTLGVN